MEPQAPDLANGVRRHMTLSRLLIAVACLVATDAGAQSLVPKNKEKSEPKSRSQREEPLPKQYLPPSGMCRIWVDNVPAARQPAPTDCTTAIRNRPPNARVIFGPGPSKDDKNAKPGRARPDTTKRKPPE